jgi:hypothetical protein
MMNSGKCGSGRGLYRGTKEDDEEPTPPQPHPTPGPATYEAEAVRGVSGVPIGPIWAFS